MDHWAPYPSHAVTGRALKLPGKVTGRELLQKQETRGNQNAKPVG